MGLEALVFGFVLNTAASLGLSLVASWISPPKKKSTTADGVPMLGSGNPLYYIWGTSFVPTQVFYAVPPNKAGHSEEFSSYGVLGFANPDSTAGLIALRLSDYLVSSKDVLFPLNLPSSVKPIGETYINGYGLRTYNGLTYETQLATTVYNRHFANLGYPNLRYQGLTWLSIRQAERKIFGGNNSRITLYAQNAITSVTGQTFDIASNAPVTVMIIYEHPRFIGGWQTEMPFEFPNGFTGSQAIRGFKNGNNDSRFSVIGFGADGKQYVVRSYIEEYGTVKYKILTPVLPGAPGISSTPFAVRFGGWGEGSTTASSVIIGTEGRSLKQIPLNPPMAILNGLYSYENSASGLTYITNGTPDGTRGPIAETQWIVYGWNGTMFTNDGDTFRAINESSLVSGSLASSGTRTESGTTLQRIISDMFNEKRGDSQSFNISFLTQTYTTLPSINIRGYTATLDDIKSNIINLATAFALLIDEFSEPGSIIFREYPDGKNTVRDFRLSQYLEEPQIEYSPDISQPNQVELAYRSWEKEFAEQTISVGYGSPYPNKQSYRIDLVLTELEARKVAWTMLFITSHTNTAVKIRVADIAGLTIGSVVMVEMPNAPLIKMLIVGIDIGADRTFQVSCINFIEIYSLLKGAAAEQFSKYMLGESGASTSTGNSTITNVYSQMISTEVTGQPEPLVYYTEDLTPYVAFSINNVETIRKTPDAGGFRGQVSSVESLSGNQQIDIVSVRISRTSGNTYTPSVGGGVLRIGSSWVSYTSYQQDSSLITLSGVRVGLFASYPTIKAGDKVIYLSTGSNQNTVPGSVVSTTSFDPSYLTQSGGRRDLLALPVSTQLHGGIQIGEVTLEFPYGSPLSGYVVASVMSSYFGGRLRLWIGEPGGKQSDSFFLNDPVYLNYAKSFNFWVKPNTGDPIYLGSRMVGYQEVAVVMPEGAYRLYTARSDGSLLLIGSHSWLG